jgi:hypothetical protein
MSTVMVLQNLRFNLGALPRFIRRAAAIHSPVLLYRTYRKEDPDWRAVACELFVDQIQKRG